MDEILSKRAARVRVTDLIRRRILRAVRLGRAFDARAGKRARALSAPRSKGEGHTEKQLPDTPIPGRFGRRPRESERRALVLFGPAKLEEMLHKGNVGYLRHYEAGFDAIFVVYLYGRARKNVIRNGRVVLVSVGTARHVLDLIIAPLRLYRVARRVQPTGYLTGDQVFSFWTASLIRLFRLGKVVLQPVAMPHELHRLTGRSMSGLPMAIERMFIKMSYRAATKIVTTANADSYARWLAGDPLARPKLQVVPCLVEEFPLPELMRKLEKISQPPRPLGYPARLLYVGRLHPEKRTLDLVEMMAHLRRREMAVRLTIAGDGIEAEPMRRRAQELAVLDGIEWLGFVPAEQLADVYAQADIFVSPNTGTALREAGLAGLPVVAYATEFVQALLRHEESALLVPAGDAAGLASGVERLIRDNALRARLATRFHAVAKTRWKTDRIAESLAAIFG